MRLTREARKERDRRIVAMYRGGASMEEIGGRVGLGRSTVGDIIHRDAPETLRRVGSRLPVVQEAWAKRNASIVEAVREGQSPAVVGERFGLSGSWVARIVQGAAPEVAAARRAARQERDRGIVEAYRQEEAIGQIGRFFSVSDDTVRLVVRRDAPEILRLPGRHATPERDRRFVEAYRGGRSFAEIGRRFGVCEATVRKAVRRKAPEAVRPPGRRADPERDRAVVEAVGKGLPTAAVAEQFGLSLSGVQKIVRRDAPEECKRRQVARANPERDRAMVAAYADGASLAQVAREFGVGRGTVRRAVLRLDRGVLRRRGSAASRQLSPERAQRIVAAYRGGESANAIAQRFGCAWSTVRAVVGRLAPELRDRDAERHRERAVRIVTARREGRSLEQIAHLFGIHATTARNVVREYAPALLPSACATAKHRERDARIVEARRQGLNTAEIARREGVTAPTVRAVICRAAPSLRLRQGPQRKGAAERNRRILAARGTGASFAEIGRREGLSRQAVRYIVKRAGQNGDRPTP